MLLLILNETPGSGFREGESCPDAKPSLATSENSFLSPVAGGLVDAAGLFPRALDKWKIKLPQLVGRTVISNV